MQLPEVDRAIQCVLEKGWTIKDQLTVRVYEETCCPMGAVVVCADLDALNYFRNREVYSREIAAYLGRSQAWVAGFMEGFDSSNFIFGLSSDYYQGRVYGIEYRTRFDKGEFQTA